MVDVTNLVKLPKPKLDFVIDGIHFGRGDTYINEITSEKYKHKTIGIKSWKIIEKKLQEIDDKSINKFNSFETYIIQWKIITEKLDFKNDNIIDKQENNIYFYWKGEDATKGYSPLPESIEKENPPVERIVQWSEPPVFLRLFSGRFIVDKGQNDNPKLFILRGEIENEIHLFEIELKKENLRTRTSFLLYFPKENKSVIWHGSKSSSHCRNSIRKITENTFGNNITEIEETSKNEIILKLFNINNDFVIEEDTKIIDYTPRLFYLNKITGNFSATEIQCCHKSDFITPFPFLQSHLYSADQPAILLLDDNDDIWIWYGWNHEDNDDFKSECFNVALNYAKEKSKTLQKLVKVHKVIAGFEPISFTNLFPVWKQHQDVVKFQEKEGVLQNLEPLIEIICCND